MNRYPKIPTALVYVISWIVCSCALSQTLLSSQNTLRKNGHWSSTKLQLERGVPGGFSAFEGLSTLVHNHLNLKDWGGFQEFTLKDEGEPLSVEFDFVLVPGSFLTFLINKGPSGFDGIRISANDRYPGAYLSGKNDGEFTRLLPIPELDVNKLYFWPRVQTALDRDVMDSFQVMKDFLFTALTSTKAFPWIHARFVQTSTGEVTFQLEDARPIPLPVSHRPGGHIGFRGPYEAGNVEAIVDNFRVVFSGNAPEIRDDFSGSERRWPLTGAIALVLLSMELALRLWRHGRFSLRSVIILNCFLTSCAVGLFLINWCWFSNQYFEKAPDLRFKSTLESPSDVMAGIQARYAPDPQGRHRVLFLGGSQTWGAGARFIDDTMVRRIERRLNQEALPGRRFECINAAAPGLTLSEILKQFRSDLARLKPELVVLNLPFVVPSPSNRYEADLVEIIQLMKSIRANLIIVPAVSADPAAEDTIIPSIHVPRSVERFAQHWTDQVVAAKQGATIVDLDTFLYTRRNTGFIWWDLEDLTSYGHKLAADCLYAAIQTLLSPNHLERGRVPSRESFHGR